MQSVIKGGWTYRVENPVERTVSALKELAQQIRTDSWAFVREGPKMLHPSEANARQQGIIMLAGEIDKLAVQLLEGKISYSEVDAILLRLRDLGFFPDGLLVSNVARSIHALEQRRPETDAATESL
jgi:hypothetical protein